MTKRCDQCGREYATYPSANARFCCRYRADRLTRALEQAREYLQGGRSGYKQLAVDTIVAALSDPGGVEE